MIDPMSGLQPLIPEFAPAPALDSTIGKPSDLSLGWGPAARFSGLKSGLMRQNLIQKMSKLQSPLKAGYST